VRRILAHVEFRLPDALTRRLLWQRSIPQKLPCDPDVRSGLDFLVEASEGLSGADIVNVIVKAAMRAVTRAGELRRVTRNDISEVIANVRAAQRNVGGSRPATVSEEMLSKEQSAALLRQHNGASTASSSGT
jgi:AAA+ superfamily predicted ATPase